MEETTQLAPPQMVQGDPRTLTLLDVNARFMPHEKFRQLVANIKRDGHLTSTPLVWNDRDSGRLIVLSGNHRTLAAIEAGLASIWWMQIDEPLPRQRQIAIQLSHNAIDGEDDPAILKELYDELESVEWRQYTGLDDKALDLLDKVDVSSLGEANLDFASVQFMFLPDELERAEAAFDAARATASADRRWVAGLEQYEQVLDALETSRAAYKIGNSAAALGVILAVFERHLGELADGWYDPASGEAARTGTAPLETLFGVREVPVETAAAVRATITDWLRMAACRRPNHGVRLMFWPATPWTRRLTADRARRQQLDLSRLCLRNPRIVQRRGGNEPSHGGGEHVHRPSLTRTDHPRVGGDHSQDGR